MTRKGQKAQTKKLQTEPVTVKESRSLQVKKNCFINGQFFTAGSVVDVSQELYERFISEGDSQVIPL